MGKTALRLFPESYGAPLSPKPRVRLKLRDVFPLLVYAHRHSSVWLKDLANDEIVVTDDVADVLHSLGQLTGDERRA